LSNTESGTRRAVTSYDVARRARVSQSAVSRCFTPGKSVSPAMRARIEEAAAALGYTPNAIARSLITRRSGLVGLVVTDATLRSFPVILHDLSDALERADLLPLLVTLAHEEDLAKVLPRILHYRPEAVLTLATASRASIDYAAARGVPCVLINRAAPSTIASSIRCDQALGVRQLVERLLAAGHRRFAFLGGKQDAPVSEERLRGFRQALRRANVAPLAIEHADYTYEAGRVAASALLRARPRPDVLVCASDTLAIGALDAARVDLRLDVPRELSVTGFDDIAESGHPTRDLTTVRQPTREMAQAVVEALDSLRAGAPHVVRLIPGELRWRGSAHAAGRGA
jgi:DNA-binding LacI/PurR family transcriptional regulator